MKGSEKVLLGHFLATFEGWKPAFWLRGPLRRLRLPGWSEFLCSLVAIGWPANGPHSAKQNAAQVNSKKWQSKLACGPAWASDDRPQAGSQRCDAHERD